MYTHIPPVATHYAPDTRQTDTGRQTMKSRDRLHLQMIVRNVLKPQISTNHA